MNKKTILISLYFLTIFIIVTLIHYFGMTIKNDINGMVEQSGSSYKEVLYSALVLENYGKLTNAISVAAVFIFFITIIWFNLLQLKSKWLFSTIISVTFFVSEFLFFKNYF